MTRYQILKQIKPYSHRASLAQLVRAYDWSRYNQLVEGFIIEDESVASSILALGTINHSVRGSSP